MSDLKVRKPRRDREEPPLSELKAKHNLTLATTRPLPSKHKAQWSFQKEERPTEQLRHYDRGKDYSRIGESKAGSDQPRNDPFNSKLEQSHSPVLFGRQDCRQDKFDQLRQQNSSLEELLEEANSFNKTMLLEIQRLKEEQASARKHSVQGESQRAKLLKTIQRLRQSNSAVEQPPRNMEQRLLHYFHQLEERDKQIKALQLQLETKTQGQPLREIEERLQGTLQEVKLLRVRLGQLEEENGSLKEASERLREENGCLELQSSRLFHESKEMGQRRTQLESTIRLLKEENAKLGEDYSRKLQKIKKSLQEKNSKIIELEEHFIQVNLEHKEALKRAEDEALRKRADLEQMLTVKAEELARLAETCEQLRSNEGERREEAGVHIKALVTSNQTLQQLNKNYKRDLELLSKSLAQQQQENLQLMAQLRIRRGEDTFINRLKSTEGDQSEFGHITEIEMLKEDEAQSIVLPAKGGDLQKSTKENTQDKVKPKLASVSSALAALRLELNTISTESREQLRKAVAGLISLWKAYCQLSGDSQESRSELQRMRQLQQRRAEEAESMSKEWQVLQKRLREAEENLAVATRRKELLQEMLDSHNLQLKSVEELQEELEVVRQNCRTLGRDNEGLVEELRQVREEAERVQEQLGQTKCRLRVCSDQILYLQNQLKAAEDNESILRNEGRALNSLVVELRGQLLSREEILDGLKKTIDQQNSTISVLTALRVDSGRAAAQLCRDLVDYPEFKALPAAAQGAETLYLLGEGIRKVKEQLLQAEGRQSQAQQVIKILTLQNQLFKQVSQAKRQARPRTEQRPARERSVERDNMALRLKKDREGNFADRPTSEERSCALQQEAQIGGFNMQQSILDYSASKCSLPVQKQNLDVAKEEQLLENRLQLSKSTQVREPAYEGHFAHSFEQLDIRSSREKSIIRSIEEQLAKCSQLQNQRKEQMELLAAELSRNSRFKRTVLEGQAYKHCGTSLHRALYYGIVRSIFFTASRQCDKLDRLNSHAERVLSCSPVLLDTYRELLRELDDCFSQFQFQDLVERVSNADEALLAVLKGLSGEETEPRRTAEEVGQQLGLQVRMEEDCLVLGDELGEFRVREEGGCWLVSDRQF